MSRLHGFTALACLVVFTACDSPTAPPATAEVAFANGATKSTGAPTIADQAIVGSGVFSCATFDVRQDIDATLRTWTWLNADGSLRFQAHVQGRFTFTNLTSGLVLVNDVNYREEVLISADGLLIGIRQSGVLLKVREDARGKQIVYQMGMAELTIDFSTNPPTVEFDFHGRVFDQIGPCEARGAPTP